MATVEQRKVELRGANKELFRSKEREVILAGPADTGKTWASLTKAHAICALIPGAQGAMVRKTAVSLTGTVVRSFLRLTKGTGVEPYGGESPTRFVYPNGSMIWLGGMDNPDRVLSSERDFIYVNQAEELSLEDWETLLTRCTGRAAVVKHPQLFGDCNPGGSRHWIRMRSNAGKLRLLNATHKDNPTIYNADGTLTESGVIRLAALDSLTGIRRLRLKEGVWATAEGAVYPMFNAAVHVFHREPSEMVRWYLAMDEGFTNPQANVLIGCDSDGRWHVFDEYYVTQQLESEIVAQAKGWFEDVRLSVGNFTEKPVRCQMAACDAAAAGLIASLNAAGVYTRAGKGLIGGNGKVKGGIDKIQDRLKVQADGNPRLSIEPGKCPNIINEFESYVWKEGKDIPVDEHNHAIGALRYLEDALGEPTGAFDVKLLEIREQETESTFVDIDIFGDGSDNLQ